MRTMNESLPKHATRIVLRSKGVPPSFRLSFRPSGSLSEDPRRENTPTLTQSRLGREGGREETKSFTSPSHSMEPFIATATV